MKRVGIGDVRKRYGIHRRLITEMVRGGFVQPQRGAKREYRFSFQDIVLLRMAQELIRSGIAPKKTSRFLLRLRERMPAIPAAGLRFSTAGRDIVIRENGSLCTIDGQMILDFDSDPHTAAPAPVVALQAAGTPHAIRLSAEAVYRAALALEPTQPLQAVQHYFKVIHIDQTYAAAYVNLGCLLIDGGNYAEADIVLKEGIEHCPDNALLHFNLGIVFEETGKPASALARYRHAIDLKPAFADAHYNAARLCETLGHAKAALRHLNAYRRLESLA